MSIQQQTSAQYFKSLTIVHFSLAAGQLLFAGMTNNVKSTN
jgi:hypothetical protein